MNCEQHQSDLDAYLDSELDGQASQAFEAHAAGCSACGKRLARARDLARALREYPVAGPHADFAERALAAACRRQRPPRTVAAGFLAAFAASVLTIIYTGLMVGAPQRDDVAAIPTVSMSLAEARTVNLVFAADMPLDDVNLRIDLPPGVEVLGYEGERQVAWNTRLASGKNVLPLQLRAIDTAGGRLTARLRHGDQERVFRIDVAINDG